jgi:hypothetical protein
MTEGRLAELLRVADAPPPTEVADLARRVRGAAQTRARRRQVAAATLTLIGVAVGATFWMTREHPRVAAPPLARAARAPVSPTTVARLKSEAQVHSTVATAVHARELRRRLSVPDAAATVELERDKAALAMLDHAERLRRDLRQVDAALATYRRTAELFPGTRWAAVAKERIEQIKPGARRTRSEHTLT